MTDVIAPTDTPLDATVRVLSKKFDMSPSDELYLEQLLIAFAAAEAGAKFASDVIRGGDQGFSEYLRAKKMVLLTDKVSGEPFPSRMAGVFIRGKRYRYLISIPFTEHHSTLATRIFESFFESEQSIRDFGLIYESYYILGDADFRRTISDLVGVNIFACMDSD